VRRPAAAFALLLFAVLVAGCADRRAAARAEAEGPSVRGGTLEIVGNSDVTNLSTISAYVDYSMWLTQTFARRLFAYPPAPDYATKTQPAPDVAREVPARENGGISADGLTYTVRLRRGVRWNTAPPREVTAYDVVRAFKLFCNPVSPVGARPYYLSTISGLAEYCARFDSVPGTVAAIRTFVTSHEIDGVRAADDTTLVFRLLAPATDFLNLLAMPFTAPVPVEYLAYSPDGPESRQHTISNGPYQIVRYVQNREFLMERNPAWDARTDPIRPAYVDRIRIRLGLDAQLQQLQIEAGTADLSFGQWVPPAELAALLTLEDPTVLLSPAGDVYGSFTYLALNIVGPNNGGALKRLDVRRAIALAVDKAACVQLFGGPRVARALYQAVPSSTAGFRRGADRDVTPGDRGNPAAARALLAQAGYPNGIKLRLAYPNIPSGVTIAQTLQVSLKRAGIDVRLAPSLLSDLYGRLLSNPENARRGEWDMALAGWAPDWYGDNNGRAVIAPLFDGRQFGPNSMDFGGYLNRDVSSAIDRAITAPSAAQAERHWADAVRRLTDDVAIVPLMETKNAYARSRRVRGCTWAVFGLSCEITALWLADAERRPGDSR
jgi:peptide/nickel transport system substrate-binding protein